MERGKLLLKYQREKERSILKLKDSLEIVINGPYYPKSELNRLRHLKEAMIKDGYTKTSLVEDFTKNLRKEDHDISAAETSYLLMENADLIYFVFLFKGKKGGVSDELCHFSDALPHRHFRGVVFDEIIEGVPATSRLSRRHTKINKIDYVTFDGEKKDEEELQPSACQIAFEFLLRYSHLYKWG